MLRTLTPGTRVRFRGGSRRNDEAAILEGIVNGDPIVFENEHVTLVPVHLPGPNHNIMVHQTNLIGCDDD